MAMVLVLSIGTATVFADTPSEILEDIAGVTQEEVKAARDEGKTIHDLAEENGVTDEFNTRLIEDAEARINQLLEDGKITEEKAATIIESFKEKIETGDYGALRGRGNRDGERGQDRPEREPLLTDEARDAMKTEMDGTRETIVDQLVVEELITQEIADEVKAAIVEKEATDDGERGRAGEKLNLKLTMGEEAAERFKELMEVEKSEAVNKLVEDGVITQEIADQMEERAAEREARRAEGFGNGKMQGQRGRGNNDGMQRQGQRGNQNESGLGLQNF